MTRLLTVSTKLDLITEQCCNCGVLFAMPEELFQQLQKKKQWFYCPNGHQQYYTESLEDKLQQAREQRDRARAALDQSEALARDLQQQRDGLTGEVRRMNRRAAAGVCQFCRRNFANVARHVEKKHPSPTDTKASDG